VRRVDVGGGVRLHVEERGTGPALVLLHGLFCDGRMFDEAAADLAADHRVVAIDGRAHGRSDVPPSPYDLATMADDVAAVLDASSIERVVLGGVSMGAMVAMHAMLRHPSRVRALMLMDTEPGRPPWRNWLERRALVAAAFVGGMRRTLARAVVRRMFADEFRRRRPDVIARFEERVAAVSPRALRLAARAVDDRPSLVDRLPAMTVPTLVVWGSEDAYTPLEAGRRMCERLPAASLVVVPGAGHLAVTERPEAVVEAIRVFTASIVESGGDDGGGSAAFVVREGQRRLETQDIAAPTADADE